ncbi:putative bifunctional diguanylate cyclase/phosphodiesterase [Methylomonas methanica]|uniref:cyclic-guanylate-specific phosphodiesterase n=1 Tax=Methylomonas methanica (strain DSM 25384 / MC09) TaxID=857087 RepID=G0A6R9_METMM|nr:EAL domain-containing protein [Methylomonas methanica]AEG00540.1 diguanylate cyclase/phosphodiesterase [Methylomonas methanica MC09]
MKRDEVIPILYEMALTIGGETSVDPLLTRCLQRLLYYTSFPAGFICLDLPKADTDGMDFLTVTLDAAVGDYQLIKHVGEQLALPKQLLLGPALKADDQSELLSGMPATQGRYQAFLRLPIGNLGVIILMAPQMPETELPLTLMFDPIMAHLERAILLCRNNDRYAAQLIADKQQADTRAEFLALHDALTGLPNRGLLLDRIQQAMAMGTHTGQYGALMTLNIDHFKQLNDYYGYEACDQILIDTARRLEACVREGDTVARFGGDEFMLLIWPLPATQNEAAIQAEQIAQKVQKSLTPPLELNGRELAASFSIGISLFRAHLDALETVLRNAETSVYQAKIAGRNTIRFFDPGLQSVITTRLALEADLRRAMPLNEFRLYYQIQADDQGRITGAEVLIRWQHPKRGLVSPAVFIPLAEETGAIVEIGDWVMQMACEQLRAWQQHARMRHLELAVNVSAVQFHQQDFIDKVCRLMADYGEIAGLLKLELTESVMLDSAEEVIHKIQILKNLGLRFSMDDFGTGYSSLAYLKRLPLDQLKIDQSFVRDIANDPSAAVIIQTIIGMAQNLGLEVIAEGLETKEQLALLKQYGCRHYQGYLLGRPLPINEFDAVFAQANPGLAYE